ncbi:hypothetical protein [Runella slithyformis]|uniref:Uncharacterized protein n=1 Tax=Runella slithyformis (strain ATCC 29530 / DSM 19594 / LMG 11500 / NCIMB 11436 / LSU 4) TaxID=761193 RepID=A0A7U4E7M3_RUNSL|nr:hypothetical protein [Runella slithyformis]AEI50458.1 hypothetical protein Runsl_4111 [Runella slithyformis DSM 19594]
MKKIFIVIILTTFVLACHKDQDGNVDPQKALLSANQKQSAARLSADEARVAASLGGIIPFKEAKSRMEAYQKTSPDEIKGVAFGKDIIEKLMDKKGVVGLRFYFTKGKDGKTSLVFVGINKDGKDVTTTSNARSSDEEGVGGDPAPCPGFCNE